MKYSSLEILKEMLLYYLPEMVLLASFPVALVVKNAPANAGNIRGTSSSPELRKISWRRS